MSEIAHASTAKERSGLLPLLFGAGAAPIVWLGQVMLGFGVSAYVCYPADHPVMIVSGNLLRSALVGFDIVAIIAALAGGLTAFVCLSRAQQEKDSGPCLHIAEGRARFLALWGIFSSLCFFCAILFNVIASITVPLCAP